MRILSSRATQQNPSKGTFQTASEIFAVVGPTATGKTVIGAAIARLLGSEVISVDSQLAYRELSIGVARPTPEEMQGVPHHMIGVISPDESFSAGQYAAMAVPILKQLLEEGKKPVLVGGTGFYLRALLQPEHIPPVPSDSAVRESLRQQEHEEGPEALYKLLRQADPERASQIHPNDSMRIRRALEIIHLTGKSVPATPVSLAFPVQAIGLTFADRERHIQAIRRRLYHMMDQGFLEEVRLLYERYGLCPALQKAHGYPELVQVIQKKRSVESALEQTEINIRQYSKRQMTWFRKFPGIRWCYVDEQSQDEIITSVIQEVV